MEHLWTSFTVVMPLTVIMAVGFLLKRCSVVSEDNFFVINRIIFYVGIPTLVFRSIVMSADGSGSRLFLALWLIGWVVLTFVLSQCIVPRFMKDPSRRGVVVQALSRSNDAVFGLAVATAMFGADNLGTMAFAVALTVPMFNICGVAALEINRGGKVHVGRILWNIAKNPIVIAVVLAYAVRLIGITVPSVVMKPIGLLADLCTPLGFLVLGGILSFRSISENRKPLFWVSLIKLIVLPLVVIAASLLVGFRGEELLAVLIIFGAPTAMAGFPLACAMGGDGKLAGELVAITTALSLPTMFILLTVFGGWL